MELSGWGRYPSIRTELCTPRDLAALQEDLAGDGRSLIARGNGRAYGDSAVNPIKTVSMRQFRHILAFDPETGIVAVEAGVTLGEIISSFLPLGWFPWVTPGTKFVTIGGAIAADVHGKNHHRDGSFGTCVMWMDILTPDGQVLRASRQENVDLFHWSLGGMGLTGVILRAGLRLRPVESGWIQQRTLPAADLAATMAGFEQADDAPYSVAWIDCLARGRDLGRTLLMLGHHATRAELPRPRRRQPFTLPAPRPRRLGLDLPGWTLNRWSLRAFNQLYWSLGQRTSGPKLVSWDSFFYPLDSILGWNRIYGRKGFVQFQCVLPPESAEPGLRALLGSCAEAGEGSFLAVLKRLGPQESRFSFPMGGYTLALDFPVRPRVLRLLERLDAITLDHGGRFYLAKDARMSADTLRRSDPRVSAFQTMRQDSGAAARFTSAQSERLLL